MYIQLHTPDNPSILMFKNNFKKVKCMSHINIFCIRNIIYWTKQCLCMKQQKKKTWRLWHSLIHLTCLWNPPSLCSNQGGHFSVWLTWCSSLSPSSQQIKKTTKSSILEQSHNTFICVLLVSVMLFMSVPASHFLSCIVILRNKESVFFRCYLLLNSLWLDTTNNLAR